ncbi:MAG TPA: response regulator transcription factor [Candidatus Polarisedimenticolia bacterium]|nr:response regulator transcription factor [Candidatus Polarisedimenticolia bacterium]
MAVYLLATQAKARVAIVKRVRLSTDERKKHRILLVDDHPLVRRALRQTIDHEEDMAVCGEAEDREDALAAVAGLRPTLAIIDLSLKTSDGLDLVKDIRKKHSNVLTIVLSMHNESFHAERVIRAGANGYVSKQEDPAKVIEAIRKVLAGEIYWPEKAIAEVVNRLAGRGFSQDNEVSTGRLSGRELQVFELLGMGSTPAQIAEIMDVEVSTVDTYQSRIKEKLSLKGATELRHEAIRWNVAKNTR